MIQIINIETSYDLTNLTTEESAAINGGLAKDGPLVLAREREIEDAGGVLGSTIKTAVGIIPIPQYVFVTV